jgi:putative nucleotidyltransferase-like protein
MTRRLRPHEEAVLLTAGTRARRAAAAPRLQALLERVSWTALLEELARQRLVPLLGARILEAAASAPEEFVDAVERETRGARAVGELGELVTLRVATALESAGVPNVPLKGPLQARALHVDAAMRSSRDIDVLVARDALARSVDALAALGWHVDPSAAPPVLHVRLVSGAGLPDVELHWRIHWYEREFARRALDRATPGRDGVRRMQPADALAALALYHARDGLAGLRHATDAAAWWDAHGTAADGPVLGAAIAAHPALERALTASALVLDPLVGIPAGALVGAPPRVTWSARRAVALANPLMHGSAAQLIAEASLVDGLLAPPGRRRASVRRRALPSPQELPRDPRDRSLAVRRAEHLARLAVRCAFAIVRRRPAPAYPIG